MMNDDLLAAIIERPDDDDARLVYADALTAAGDSRGEFIVVQVELAKLGVETVDDVVNAPLEVLSDANAARAGALLRREKELLTAHAETWIDALLGPDKREKNVFLERVRARFRRGFVHEVHIADDADAAVVSELTSTRGRRHLSPVFESIHVGVRDDGVERLRLAGCFDRAKEIVLDNPDAETFKRVMETASHLEKLEIRNLATQLGQHLDTATTTKLQSLLIGSLTPESVLRAPCMRTVKRLDLEYYGPPALDLLDASLCPSLEYVSISDAVGGGRPRFDVSAAFKNRKALPKLKTLRVTAIHSDHLPLADILDSRIASTLQTLIVTGEKIKDRDVEAAAALPSIKTVDFASLWSSAHTAESLAPLISRPTTLGSLHAIGLHATSVTSSSLETLLSQNPALRLFTLGGQRYGPATHDDNVIDVIAKHAPASLRSLRLRWLDLSNNDRIATLVSAPCLSNLRSLGLCTGALSDDGARIVSEAPMKQLVEIDLNGNAIVAGARAFVHARETFPALARLWLVMPLRADAAAAKETVEVVSRALGPLYSS